MADRVPLELRHLWLTGAGPGDRPKWAYHSSDSGDSTAASATHQDHWGRSCPRSESSGESTPPPTPRTRGHSQQPAFVPEHAPWCSPYPARTALPAPPGLLPSGADALYTPPPPPAPGAFGCAELFGRLDPAASHAACALVLKDGGSPDAVRKRRRTRRPKNTQAHPSRGSKNHQLRQCRPCRSFSTLGWCKDGALCNFCHYPHDESRLLEADLYSAKARQTIGALDIPRADQAEVASFCCAPDAQRADQTEVPELVWKEPWYVPTPSFSVPSPLPEHGA